MGSGLAASMLIASAWVMSWAGRLDYHKAVGDKGLVMSLGRGRVVLFTIPFPFRTIQVSGWHPEGWTFVSWPDESPIQVPSYAEHSLDLPLWIPFLLLSFVAIATGYELLRARHRAATNRCLKCAYNQAGKADGVCLECDARIAREQGSSDPFWRRTPEERAIQIKSVVRAAMADLCEVPPNSIDDAAPMQSLWQMQFDGEDEIELMEMLKKKLSIRIADSWWAAQIGDNLTFGRFAQIVTTYVETQVMTCPCGYNLTGNVSGRCPECGEKI